MQSTEHWQPVRGYAGRYEVSSHGRVRSNDTTDSLGRKHLGRVLKPTPIPSGYLTVVLYRDGRQTHSVHRLVAEAFLGLSDFPVVRHLDGSRDNNHASNLAWGTFAENSQDSVAHGTNSNARKTACIRGHKFTPDNTGIRKLGNRYCKKCESNRVLAVYYAKKEI